MNFLKKLLILFVAFPAYAQDAKQNTPNIIRKPGAIIKHYVSSDEAFERLGQGKRTIDFPTQIIRISGTINEANLYCDDVFGKIDDDYLGFVTGSGKTTYNSYIYCGFNPETEKAERFSISTYFDPLTDSAVDEVKEWLEVMNGTDLYGTPFVIESARELVVSLKVSAGVKESEKDPNLLVFKTQTSNHYFKTDYQMKQELMADIKNQFYSLDHSVVLPFFAKWFYPSSEATYNRVLRASNYVYLEPERIFLMDKEPKIFTPMVKMTYAHSCFNSPSKFCL
jgi:hypothetical protein